MKKWSTVFVAALMFLGAQARSQTAAPIKLIQTYELPAEVKGNFDHFGIDLKGGRLFATPEGYHAVVVFDPATNYLYIDNGGGDVHQTYSMLSVVDTTAGTKLADLKIDGDTLEAMALEKSTPKMYVNNRAKNQVSVVDREKRELVASWPVTLCKNNVAMALDEASHRLFVACRTSQIAVLDTQTGKEITSFAITKGVDDITYDAGSKRIYAACDGAVDIYEQSGPDTYKLVANVPTGPMGRTARLVPELKRYFVAVPQHGATSAKVLVFEVL